MTSKLKKAYDSKPAGVFKSILTGVGVLATAVALIIGVMLGGPLLLMAAAVIAQIGGWIFLFCVVILLPLWGIGKLCGWGWACKSKNNNTKCKRVKVHEEETAHEEEVQEEEEGTKEYYERKLKEAKDSLKQKYDEKVTRIKRGRGKRAEFDKKVINLKNAVTALFK